MDGEFLLLKQGQGMQGFPNLGSASRRAQANTPKLNVVPLTVTNFITELAQRRGLMKGANKFLDAIVNRGFNTPLNIACNA